MAPWRFLMPNLQQCRQLLSRRGIDLSEEKLGHLMEILQYLAIRVCEQAEVDAVKMGTAPSLVCGSTPGSATKKELKCRKTAN
jgi:hypothetical protein